MSRHRRQQRKRFRAALARVSFDTLMYGVGVWERRGFISKRLAPIERLAVIDQLKREGFRV